uniref:Uncharacterized protein n=1 Tax=uncultured Bacteroidota bacterium TaxID=152509 RepID=H5SBM2_9BACT|nr:hypothetical protein HGMM_F07E12C05 [uncultured Bacteroidetes bacterium]
MLLKVATPRKVVALAKVLSVREDVALAQVLVPQVLLLVQE